MTANEPPSPENVPPAPPPQVPRQTQPTTPLPAQGRVHLDADVRELYVRALSRRYLYPVLVLWVLFTVPVVFVFGWVALLVCLLLSVVSLVLIVQVQKRQLAGRSDGYIAVMHGKHRTRRLVAGIVSTVVVLLVGGVVAFIVLTRVPPVVDVTRSLTKPAMPVSIRYREALFSNSLVLSVENLEARPLSLQLTIENQNRAEPGRWLVNVPARGTREYGHMEGLDLRRGDEIVLRHADYATMRVRIP